MFNLKVRHYIIMPANIHNGTDRDLYLYSQRKHHFCVVIVHFSKL